VKDDRATNNMAYRRFLMVGVVRRRSKEWW